VAELPHEFTRAYELVVAGLEAAIQQYDRTRQIPNAATVRDAIERFLYELELNDEWFAELARRAELIENRCGVSSEYTAVRRRALSRQLAPSDSQLFFEQRAVEALSNPFTEHPVFLSEVIGIRKSIEELFRDGFLTTKSKDGAAYSEWHKVCRGIEREGKRLEVDGCWYLQQFNSATELDAPFHSRVARELAESDIGASNLSDILAAVHSMVAWIGERNRTRQQHSLEHDRKENQLETVELSTNRQLTDGEPTSEIPVDEPRAEPLAAALRPFSGGEMVFLEDRVELCNVDICSGSRSASARKALELLATQTNGTYIAVGSEELAELLKLDKGAPGVIGLVRNIRTRITTALAPQGIRCEREDVIARTNRGYQLSAKLRVRIAFGQSLADAGGGKREKNLAGDPDGSDPNDPDRPRWRDPNGPNREARHNWILQQLALRRELRAPDIAKELGCSLKSAKRDLKSLANEGKIEFAGSSRSGSYRLRDSQNPDASSSGD